MSSRKFFAWFFICGFVPLLAAQLSLSLGWFNKASTNKGQWLQHDIQLLPDTINPTQDNIDSDVHWHLVYVQAAVCEQQCEQALFILQQLYAGMGRKQLKVQPLVMAQQQPVQLNKFPAIGWRPENKAVNELQNQIVIVNQRGLVLLRYPVDSDPDHMRDIAKNIRTDLLHLINYDRSGA
jgi:hypothetical protein